MLLDVGGQDATEPFEDVGHSDEAREILDGLLVGTLKRVVRCSEARESLLPALCSGLSTFHCAFWSRYSHRFINLPC